MCERQKEGSCSDRINCWNQTCEMNRWNCDQHTWTTTVAMYSKLDPEMLTLYLFSSVTQRPSSSRQIQQGEGGSVCCKRGNWMDGPCLLHPWLDGLLLGGDFTEGLQVPSNPSPPPLLLLLLLVVGGTQHDLACFHLFSRFFFPVKFADQPDLHVWGQILFYWLKKNT